MNTGQVPNVFVQTNDKNLSSLIFAEKKTKNSTTSATRYLNKIDKNETSPILLPRKSKEYCYRRTNSNHRQRSIYFPLDANIENMLIGLKDNESPVHTRNPSDADSVVYLGPGDCSSLNSTFRKESSEKRHEFQLSIVETASGSLLSTEKPSISSCIRSIPKLGDNETTSYCRFCKKDVHTVVEINSCYSNKLLQAFSKFFTCCSYPSWMADYFVHKCPHCSLVLGKSR
ncbi:hypothetical protein SteCoe_9356 [Stentor coeruleus]|uniref:LITAF domain-containing protein n=1 Tax=Stentor coeruleus TaxID=5963 RepID=A0A1R2CI32_9CILI|nr:hypothetical protein SteCoe_9356 [Stentor coeruleus]